MTRASSAVKVENRWRRQWWTDFPLSVSTATSSMLNGAGSIFVLYRFFKAVDLSGFVFQAVVRTRPRAFHAQAATVIFFGFKKTTTQKFIACKRVINRLTKNKVNI